MLAGRLDGLPPGRDALVHLALHAAQRGEFLAVDHSLIRLLEKALGRTGDDDVQGQAAVRAVCTASCSATRWPGHGGDPSRTRR